MTRALRERVVVKPGGIVEVCSPELPDGATADVIVLYDALVAVDSDRLADLIGAARGGFDSAQEVDAFLDAERTTWGS